MEWRVIETPHRSWADWICDLYNLFLVSSSNDWLPRRYVTWASEQAIKNPQKHLNCPPSYDLVLRLITLLHYLNRKCVYIEGGLNQVDNVINKFKHIIITLHWNKVLWLDKGINVTWNIQSEYFTSSEHRLAALKFVYGISSRVGSLKSGYKTITVHSFI